MSDQFLYQIVDVLRKHQSEFSLPSYIESGLADFIELREYQKESILNSMIYFEKDSINEFKPKHLLYHMATGSGKTVIMVSLILYLYKKGYRNFIFFVNQTNIVDKTKENFLNSASSKYLFADNIDIDGKNVKIQEVNNFNYIDRDNINIIFMSIGKLHTDMNIPKEDSLGIEDFEDNNVVMISDESHHVNTRTKLNGSEEENKNNWEYSVMKAFKSNPENVLLEFTATCDLKDENIQSKYKDKIIYNYPLREFRKSGFTKEFQNFQTESNPWERTLVAMIISEYRKNLFTDIGENTKPVILLKSRYIKDSEEFFNEFFVKLDNLNENDILKLQLYDSKHLNDALEYFKTKDSSYHSLINALKLGFNKDKAIIMNGKTDNTTEKQIAVNSLEDRNNPYRIIFTVDMLSEGWDVLNLFDIVRLYETRQSGSTKLSKYTIKEAQLIGRGARYFPFSLPNMENEVEKFKRKYDYDLDNKDRILEMLLYHSMQDSRYISEINQALISEGLLDEKEYIEKTYKVKDEFKKTDFYKTGKIYSNKRIKKNRSNITELNEKVRNDIVLTRSSVRRSKLYDLITLDSTEKSKKDNSDNEILTKNIKVKDIPKNVLYYAIANFKNLSFDKLKENFPQLTTLDEFLLNDKYAANIKIIIKTTDLNIDNNHLYDAAMDVFKMLSNYVSNLKDNYEGSSVFESHYVSNVIRDKTIKFEKEVQGGHGESQIKSTNDALKRDLSKDPWYIFNDNFGTDQEKSFIIYFSTQIEQMEEKYEEIYLIRNERFNELSLYEFNHGSRFEPDFVLILKEKDNDYNFKQIFIEPKGTQLLDKDKWKENFLKKIESETIDKQHITYVDDDKYRFIGLPFYNSDKNDKFISEFDKVIFD